MSSSHFRGPDIRTTNYRPDVSALKIIHESLKRHGDRVALINGDTGERVTFSQLLAQSSRIAGGLQRAGVAAEDLVVLCCDKSITACSLVLGAMFTGATVVLAPPPHADSIDKLTSGQAVKALFYDSQFAAQVEQSVSRMSPPPLLLGRADPQDPAVHSLLSSSDQFTMHQVRDTTQHVSLVFFSSGTTGTPKGIEVSDSHVQLVAIPRSVTWSATPVPGDSETSSNHHEDVNLPSSNTSDSRDFTAVLIASPFYWYSALCTLIGAIDKGHALVMTNSDDARYRLSLIEKYKVDCFFSNVANMIQYNNEPKIEDFDLSSVKTVIAGGEIILPSVARPFFAKVLKGRASMIVMFGSTEAGVMSDIEVGDPKGMAKYALGACGKLCKGVEMKILDDKGDHVLPGVMGNIFVKSICTKGYWRRDDLNRNFLDDEGFYDTGDAGCFDSEGNLYLRGRVCDLINFRGFNMCPAFLEDLLMGHPAVKDAVVVGRPHPEDGQRPTAFVVIKPQHSGLVSEEDIRTYVNDQVEDNMRLRGGVHFRESLPRVSNGKVIRKMV